MKESLIETQEKKASAAILACGMGCFIFGICVMLVEIIPTMPQRFIWVKPVGPLSGEIGVSVIAWLVIWYALSQLLKNKKPNGIRYFNISLTLIFLAFLFTFPPFFNLFK